MRIANYIRCVAILKNNDGSELVGLRIKMKKISCGFTLIELMIVVSLISVLVSVGVPSFKDLMERNQLTSSINQFVSSLSLARSEAIKRKQKVVLCASNDGKTCAAGTGYEIGWIVYAENEVPENNRDEDNQALIWVQESLADSLTLYGNTSSVQSPLQYGATGRINGIGGRVTLCKNNRVDKARAITINPTGRVHQVERNEKRIPVVSGAAINKCV